MHSVKSSKTGILILLSILASTTQAAQLGPIEDYYVRYPVKQGEEIGKILLSFKLIPLWGKDGWVADTVALNERLNKSAVIRKDGNLIYPKEILILPVIKLPSGCKYSVMKSGHKLLHRIEEQDLSLCNLNEVRESNEKWVESSGNESDVGSEILSGFMLQPELFFTRLDGTDLSNRDSQGVLLSNVNFGLNLGYRHRYREGKSSWQSFGWLKMARLSFKEEAQRPLNEDSRTLFGFTAGASYFFPDQASRWRLDLLLTVDEEIYFRALSLQTLALESVWFPKIKALANFRFFDNGTYTLTGVAGPSLAIPVSLSGPGISAGFGYQGRLVLGKTAPIWAKQLRLEAELRAERQSFETEVSSGLSADQTRTDLGLGITLIWRLNP